MKPVVEEQEEVKPENLEEETEVVEETNQTLNNNQQEQPKLDQKALAEEYLNLARVIQADFDNYRKRSLE